MPSGRGKLISYLRTVTHAYILAQSAAEGEVRSWVRQTWAGQTEADCEGGDSSPAAALWYFNCDCRWTESAALEGSFSTNLKEFVVY